MFDKEFLKTLTVMYVEDDESIRTSLGSILKKIFGEVIICIDGNDGVNQYNFYTQERNTVIDCVISDINMPNMNGIEMTRAIREHDTEIPVVFTTAHGESNYLMEAIKLKVSYYALKPINTTELLQNVSKLCTIEHNKALVAKKEKQLEQYMVIMDGITSLCEIDLHGNIIKDNELLRAISRYEDDDLLSMNINDLLHPQSTVTSFGHLVDLIEKSEDHEYSAKLKYKTKDGSAFYLGTTIIPNINDSTSELEGYILIGIDKTGEEMEKQQTMQRVRKNIMDQRSKESDLAKKIKELEHTILKLQQAQSASKDTDFVINALNKEKQKVVALNAQLGHYEDEIATLKKQKEVMVTEEKNKQFEMMKKIKTLSKENHNLQSKVIELQSQITSLQTKLAGSSVD
jgi:PAS domain S-box-containing protein